MIRLLVNFTLFIYFGYIFYIYMFRLSQLISDNKSIKLVISEILMASLFLGLPVFAFGLMFQFIVGIITALVAGIAVIAIS